MNPLIQNSRALNEAISRHKLRVDNCKSKLDQTRERLSEQAESLAEVLSDGLRELGLEGRDIEAGYYKPRLWKTVVEKDRCVLDTYDNYHTASVEVRIGLHLAGRTRRPSPIISFVVLAEVTGTVIFFGTTTVTIEEAWEKAAFVVTSKMVG